MSNTISSVIVTLILAVIFLVALYKFWYVEGKMVIPWGSMSLRGQKRTHEPGEGMVQIGSLKANDVKIGDSTGATGVDVTQGEVHITDITAASNVEIGNTIGLDRRETRK